MPAKPYELILDESGQETCWFFESPNDALDAFEAADKRRDVFSATLVFISIEGARRTLRSFERS